MVCLIKSQYKKELEQYKNVLGSEAAAYYVLAMNNGFTLDYDPNGNESQLFKDILNAVGGDIQKAILEKSLYYSKSYLDTYGDWLSKDTVMEPMFLSLGITSTTNNVTQNILQNDEYTRIKSQLSLNGVDDDEYAMRMAIERTRQSYLDQQDAKFIEDYRQKQIDRFNSNSFFKKVIDFIKSPFNFRKLKDPDSKTKENARKRSYDEFNDTLEYLILSELSNSLSSNTVFQQWFDKKRQNNEKDAMRVFMAYVDMASKNSSVFLNPQDVVRTLALLRDLNYSLYTDGVSLFGSINALSKALRSNDTSSYSVAQQNYISNFVSELESTFIKDLKDVFNSNTDIADLNVMYHQHDTSLQSVNQQIYDVIKQGLESRLISLQRSAHSRKNLIYNIKSKLSSMEQKNVYDTNDMYQIYIDFLDSAITDMNNASNYLDECLIGTRKMSPEDIMYLQTDVLGYYNYIIQNYMITLDKSSGLSDPQIQDIKDLYDRGVKTLMSDVLNKYDVVLDQYCDQVLDKYVDENYSLGDQELHKRTLHAAIRNQIDKGHIMNGEQFFGDATQSRSEIVRIIANMLNNDERQVTRDANKIGHNLLALYKKSRSSLSKLSPLNHSKMFCELDDSGMPTGYFVRGYQDIDGKYIGINYGLFEKNKKEFESGLRKKYKLPEDGRGNTVWNFDIKGQEDIYNQYMDELDDWLDRNCNRQYKAAYYKARRAILTRQAREAMDVIQKQIQLLLDKCTEENGYVYTSNLNPGERSKLQDLYKQREQLGNPYRVQLDSTGKIIKFEKKTGEELEIAESIIEWNEFLKNNVEREPDWTSYNEAFNAITDPVKQAMFKADNTVTRISPDFYDILRQCTTATQTQEYLKASLLKNKIFGFTKDQKGYVMPDLFRLNDDAWAELKIQEQEMANLKTKGSKGIYNFDDVAVILPVTMADPNDPSKQISVLKYLENQARAKLSVDPDALNKFYDKYYIRVSDGKGGTKLKSLSVFEYIAPKNPSFIETVPVNQYTSPVGFLVNDKYRIEDSDDIYQPRADKYENKVYSKIMENDASREFYEAILDVMENSIGKLSSGVQTSKYKMPQITDKSSSIMSRKLSKANIGGAIKSLGQHFTINETDDDIYREDLAVRPDRSVVETVPIRYIKTLDDPTQISCDIVKTVTQFFAMAENFELKSQTVPVVESLISKMGGGINGTHQEEGQYKRAKTELEMYGYGRMSEGFGDKSKKMSTTEKIATKAVNNFRSIANVGLLAWNILSASKGFLAAYWYSGTEAFVGRYYDSGDRLYTTGKLLAEIPSALRSIGKGGNTKSIIQAAMQHNGLATSIENSYGEQNEYWLHRITKFFRMGIFTIGDYIINSIILTSTYHAHRLIENPSTGELMFMNEEECIDMFVKQGKTEREAVKYFDKHSGNHLLKMYELGKDGEFQLKDKVKIKINGKKLEINPGDYVTKKLENRIAGTSERLASIANGVIAEHGKGKIYQGTLSKLLVTQRGFIFSQGWARFKTGDDFTEKYYDKGELREIGVNSMYRGQYDLETGHCEPGVFQSIVNSWKDLNEKWYDFLLVLPFIYKIIKNKKNLKRADLQNIRRLCLDMTGVATFLLLCTYIFIPKVREYPDEWMYQYLALISMGAGVETATPINPVTILDLATTVTTTYAFAKDMAALMPYIGDMLGLTGHDLDEFVRSGAYKNKPRWFRDIMKLTKWTGVGGFYESFTPAIPGIDDPKKSTYIKENAKRIDRLENNGFPYMLSPDGIYDMYRIGTTPLGLQSKYDWYQGNTFPATLLPKRKDPNAPKTYKKKHKSRKTKKSSKKNKN